jgi:metal-responsive CopG/Arc/MetJ family transcriptional regulator
MGYGMNIMPRLKTPKSLALDTDLLDRLEAWITKQEFPPSQTAVFETALREFLERRESKKR